LTEECAGDRSCGRREIGTKICAEVTMVGPRAGAVFCGEARSGRLGRVDCRTTALSRSRNAVRPEEAGPRPPIVRIQSPCRIQRPCCWGIMRAVVTLCHQGSTGFTGTCTTAWVRRRHKFDQFILNTFPLAYLEQLHARHQESPPPPLPPSRPTRRPAATADAVPDDPGDISVVAVAHQARRRGRCWIMQITREE
jgi:hypothetical protein